MRIPAILMFLIIAVSGVVYVRYTWIRIEREQSENVLQIARSIVTTLPKEDLKTLGATPEDLAKSQYQFLKNTLKSIIRVNAKARFAYLYALRNGKLYFYADSESEGSKDYSPPGQEYSEAEKEYYKPFFDGKDFITGPATDRWGTWISVLVPVKEESTEKVIAVFAMDFNAKFWGNSILFEVVQSTMVILLVLLAFLFLINIKAKNRSLKYEITERKQAQEKLQESEEKYRLIFEHTPVGLLSFDKNGVIVACNDNFAKIIGSSREVLTGLNMLNLPDKKLVSTVQKALNGKPGLYEDIYQSVLTKKTSPVRALFTPMEVGNRCINGGVGIIEDITERMQADLILAQGQERARQQRNAIARVAEDELISFGDLSESFQKLTEEVTDAIGVERASIWLLSEDKTVLRCISLFENTSKKHSSGIILKFIDYPRYFEAINRASRINADDAQNDARTSEFKEGYLVPLGITSMLDAGIYMEGELKGVVCLEHTGEKRIWYSDEESFASTIASIVAQTLANNKRKITEAALRISEEKYRTIFDNIQDVFYQTSLDGIIKEISPSIKHLTGYTRDEIIDTPVYNLYYQPGDPGILMEVLTKNGELRDYELMLKTNTGEIKNVSINARLIFGSDNQPHHIDGAIRDITERKQAELEIKLTNEKLINLNAEKDKFFSIIAHDLRNPFNAFLGFTQIMVEEMNTMTLEEIKAIVLSMRKSATDLYRLLENLLEWSILQQGIAPYIPVSIPLALKITESIDLIIVSAQKKEIEINSDIPGDLSVVSDVHMLETVIRNLVSNAVKFTPRRGKIFVSARKTDGNVVEITVRDTGIGMSHHMVDNLFRLDVQTGRKGTDGEASSGLGLLICKDSIEKLGGKLWVESEEGKGTTFYFTIP